MSLASARSTATVLTSTTAIVVMIMLSASDATSFANVHRAGNVRSATDSRNLQRIVREELQKNVRGSHGKIGRVANSGDVRQNRDVDDDTVETSGTDVLRHKAELLNRLIMYGWILRKGTIEPDNVVISLSLSILSVRYDNASGIATTAVEERMSWRDSRWTWSPEEFGGITSLTLSSNHFWKPDIELYNSVTSQTDRMHGNAILESDGSIIMVSRAVYQTFCRDNYSERLVTCGIKLGSWTYNGATVGLRMNADKSSEDADGWSTDAIDLGSFDTNCGATLINRRARLVEMMYVCCPDTFPFIEAQISFKPRGW